MPLRSRPCRVALAALLFAAVLPACSHAAPGPRLVRVPLGEAVTIAELQEAGLDLLEVRRGREAVLLEWPGDDATLARLGARVDLLDADPGASAAARARRELAVRPRGARAVRSAARADGRYRIESLPPVGSGSLGGFWNLAEVKMKLDDLVASDLHDVVADAIDTIGTSRAGRPIWGLELGKRVAGPDSRPVVLFNALTHAREPGGMQALLGFVDDLLAGYGTDPWKTYLLDQRRILVCPVVNPDGYAVNESLYVLSGGASFGMWRKNVRDNNGSGVTDAGDGVDLNRNFNFQWGFNNVGSSGSTGSETYRGPSAGSEPETQAQRAWVIAHQPKTGISFHTYSDVFLHAWGYQVPATPDSNAYYEWDDEATFGSGYSGGQSTRVLYEVNGEFNDWCYGETALKPRMFSFTPEAGSPNDGFWPPPSRIVPLTEENLRHSYTVAAIAGPYVRVADATWVEGALPIGGIAHLQLAARNLGLASTGSGLEATLVPLDPGVEVYNGPLAFPTAASRTTVSATGGATFMVATADTLTPGRLLRLRVEFRDADGLFCRDTVEVPAGVSTVRLVDSANDLSNWFATGWGLRTDATHVGPFFADSPSGNYAANTSVNLRLKGWLDLSAGVHAWATFDARWSLETDYDATVFEASLDSVTWTPLAGRASVPGINAGGPQPVGQPVYEGRRYGWRRERVDLSPFAGPTATRVRLRWRTLSDAGAQFDGFNFDSIRIELYDPAAQPAAVAVGGAEPSQWNLEAPVPNPARGRASLSWALPRAGEARLEILDLQGRRVASLAAGRFEARRYVRGWDLCDDAGRPVAAGVYLARLTSAEGTRSRRIVVLR